MSTMTHHGDGMPTEHEEHGASCVLGHCATACGVILPTFATTSCATVSAVNLYYVDQSLVGVIASSDPPPPKS